jgi:hypothetical protein
MLGQNSENHALENTRESGLPCLRRADPANRRSRTPCNPIADATASSVPNPPDDDPCRTELDEQPADGQKGERLVKKAVLINTRADESKCSQQAEAEQKQRQSDAHLHI